jgi:hypothetical protein
MKKMKSVTHFSKNRPKNAKKWSKGDTFLKKSSKIYKFKK